MRRQEDHERDREEKCAIGTGMNRLAETTSPYLLQHAENPVDWYPWGDEAFARAREEDSRSWSPSATARATGAT